MRSGLIAGVSTVLTTTSSNHPYEVAALAENLLDATWREAQFDTIRLALVKVAARVTELATRIKVALPSAYPYRESLALLTARAAKLPP